MKRPALLRILHCVSNIVQFTSLFIIFITDAIADRKFIPLVCIYALLVYWKPSNYF